MVVKTLGIHPMSLTLFQIGYSKLGVALDVSRLSGAMAGQEVCLPQGLFYREREERRRKSKCRCDEPKNAQG